MGGAAPAPEAQIRAAFERALEAALERGDPPPTCHDLDDETCAALTRLARAYPDATNDLRVSARAELEMQFDGSHAREWARRYGA